MTSQKEDYDIETAWPAERTEDVDNCFRALIGMPKHVFHGAHRPWDSIKSSLDVCLEEIGFADDKHAKQTQLLERFAEQCFRHLQPEARKHIELARLRWRTYGTTGTMFVGRHFGLPTRALDWTADALVALFFACRRTPEKDGVIWCMMHQEFKQRVATQWRAAYGKHGDVVADFEDDFVHAVDKDVLVPLYFPPWMPRPVAQKAFITVAGQFCVDHARKIHELGVRACKRVIIRAELKQPIIEKLDDMGVNGYTLGIGDSTVETIATDIADALRRCDSPAKVDGECITNCRTT